MAVKSSFKGVTNCYRKGTKTCDDLKAVRKKCEQPKNNWKPDNCGGVTNGTMDNTGKKNISFARVAFLLRSRPKAMTRRA